MRGGVPTGITAVICSRSLYALVTTNILSSFLLPAGPIGDYSTNVWVSAGGSVSLPCNIEPDEPGEKVATVLWYRANTGEPIYT